MAEKQTWDFFISYAREDRTLIAEPLADLLRDAGFRVWYDEFELKVGDPLLRSIDHGLREARYGIVILSPAFFAKEWTQRELAALLSKELASKSAILPVWHKLTAKELARRSPILADRKAVSTELGLQSVAEQIVAASFPDRVDDLPITNFGKRNVDPAIRTTARALIEAGGIDDLKLFISANHFLLGRVSGFLTAAVVPRHRLSTCIPFDFAVIDVHAITKPIEVTLIVLGPLALDSYHEAVTATIGELTDKMGPKVEFSGRPSNDYLGPPYVGEYTALSEAMSKLSNMVLGEELLSDLRNKKVSMTDLILGGVNVHWFNPKVWNLKILVLLGRRTGDSLERRRGYGRISEMRVEIASYDRFLD